MLTTKPYSSCQRVAPGSPGVPVQAGPTRRSEPRAMLRHPCRVRFQHERGGEWIELRGQTVNISPQGIGLLLNMPIRVGTEVEAIFSVGGQEAQIVRGHVLHARRVLIDAYEIGVQVEQA